MKKPLVSILISTYGQLEYTKRCLNSINQTVSEKIDFETLIVDDCSEDETQTFLKSLDSGIQTFFNQKREGYAKNNNFLAAQAKGEFLCFLNNDVFVEGNWLEPMINTFHKFQEVGVVGNVQRLADSSKYDHMGVVFSPEGNPRHFGQGFAYRPFKGEIRKWSAVTAACCLVRRDYFQKIGGFDEIFVNGCEDVDLCLRINEDGKSCLVVHDSVVEHVKSASEGRKQFNHENFEVLNQRWGDLIRQNQAVSDQYLHAWTYLYRGFVKPWSVNLSKFIHSVFILLRLKKLRAF